MLLVGSQPSFKPLQVFYKPNIDYGKHTASTVSNPYRYSTNPSIRTIPYINLTRFKPLQVFYKRYKNNSRVFEIRSFKPLQVFYKHRIFLGALATDGSFKPLQVFYKREIFQVLSYLGQSFKPLQVFYKQLFGIQASSPVSEFQTLIGILQTEHRQKLRIWLDWFQTLIGILQTMQNIQQILTH